MPVEEIFGVLLGRGVISSEILGRRGKILGSSQSGNACWCKKTLLYVGFVVVCLCYISVVTLIR